MKSERKKATLPVVGKSRRRDLKMFKWLAKWRMRRLEKKLEKTLDITDVRIYVSISEKLNKDHKIAITGD